MRTALSSMHHSYTFRKHKMVTPKTQYQPHISVYLKIIFLISQPKHMLWVLKRTVSQKNRLTETVLLSTQNTCFD